MQQLRPAGSRSRSSGTCRRSRRRSRPSSSCSAPVARVAEERARARPTRRCASACVESRDAGSTRRRWRRSGRELMRQFERSLMLQTLDQHWREHLAALDHLRQGIHLRGYAQKNPKQEYKREAFELFSDMLDRIKQDVVKVVLTVQVRTQRGRAGGRGGAGRAPTCKYQHADYDEALAPAHAGRRRVRRRRSRRSCAPDEKVGRNDPCPCGSGKKYKQCHGQLGADAGRSLGRLRRAANARRPTTLPLALTMPVNYTPPTPEPLLPVAGVTLGHRRRGASRTGRATIVLLVALEPGHARRRRLHAEPLLRRAGHRLPRASRAATAGDARAGRQHRQRQCRHRRARASPTRDATCAAVARAARLRAERGAAVFHRRDHGAAAGRADRRRRCPPRMRALARRRLVRRGARDHDHRHRAEGARRAASTIDGVPVTVTGIAKGAGHDPSRTWRRCWRSSPPTRRSPPALLRAARARGRRRVVQLHHGRRRHVDQRQLRARRDRQGGACRRSTRRRRPAPARRCATRSTDVADRAGAGDRARRRRRDQVHHDRASKADATSTNAAQIALRDRAFAAGQDRVLRLRSESRPHRLRDRQRRRRPISIVAACRSGSTTCWSSTSGGRAAGVSRGRRPARDEAERDHACAWRSAAAARARPCGPAIFRTTT